MQAPSQSSSTPSGWRPVGRYLVGPRIASGGMAELYLGRAQGPHGFQKHCAIKRILPKWADDREFVEMFLDEARLAAQLGHPNVVAVLDIGEDDDGPFFAMEYLHGRDLLAISRRLRERGTTLAWDAWVAIGSAAAAGLHHAHERRGIDGRPLALIHRDVSPTNILVTYEGAVKIVDFGIAKASTSRHATRPSIRKGKMAYMSPEQCRGDAMDRRSDVFALGVVLYELATQSRAYSGDGEFAVMNRIVNHDLEPASARRAAIPAAVDRILARALARDVEQRYATARELQRDLDAFAAEAGLAATTESLASMMEDAFGVPPYPWEVEAASAADDDDDPAMQATVAKPTAIAAMSGVAARRPARRRPWLAIAAGVAVASGTWVALATVEPQADTREPPQAEADAPAAIDAPAIAVQPPAASPRETPTIVPPTSAPSPTIEPPATSPSEPSPRPTRRRPQGSKPSPDKPASSPADLPPRFDPDAPAPRVR